MKPTTFTIIAAMAALALACGGAVKNKDADTEEDAETDTAGDLAEDSAGDPASDSLEDPAPDPAEDTAVDSDEDVPTEPLEDSSEDAVEDSGTDLPPGCVVPEVPDDGLYVWYCMELDETAMLRFYREVDYPDGTSEIYSEVHECLVNPAAREMLCNLPDYGSGAELRFNIMTTGVGDAWACASWDEADPWSGVTNGMPMVWYMGSRVDMDDPVQHSVMATRCFFSLAIP